MYLAQNLDGLCSTASAMTPDIGDPMEVPFTCWYIFPSNVKTVFRQKFHKGIISSVARLMLL